MRRFDVTTDGELLPSDDGNWVLHDEAQDELAALRRGGEWVRLPDRYPAIGQRVIIYRPQHNIITSELYTGFDSDLRGVTHWMPLPGPPKEGGALHFDYEGSDGESFPKTKETT